MLIYCMKCETANKEDAEACTACGHRLKGPEATERGSDVATKRESPRTAYSAPIILSSCALALAVCTCALVLLKGQESTGSGIVGLADRIEALEQGLEERREAVAALSARVGNMLVYQGEKGPGAPSGDHFSREELQAAIDKAMGKIVEKDPKGLRVRTLYFEDLAKGNLIMFSDEEHRHLTVEVAGYLSDAEVEAWAAVAFGCTDDLITGGGRVVEKRYCQGTVGAVYNMTTDEGLKARAFREWGKMEQHRYTRAKMAEDQETARAMAAKREGKRFAPRSWVVVRMRIPQWSDREGQVEKAAP